MLREGKIRVGVAEVPAVAGNPSAAGRVKSVCRVIGTVGGIGSSVLWAVERAPDSTVA